MTALLVATLCSLQPRRRFAAPLRSTPSVGEYASNSKRKAPTPRRALMCCFFSTGKRACRKLSASPRSLPRSQARVPLECEKQLRQHGIPRARVEVGPRPRGGLVHDQFMNTHEPPTTRRSRSRRRSHVERALCAASFKRLTFCAQQRLGNVVL